MCKVVYSCVCYQEDFELNTELNVELLEDRSDVVDGGVCVDAGNVIDVGLKG